MRKMAKGKEMWCHIGKFNVTIRFSELEDKLVISWNLEVL